MFVPVRIEHAVSSEGSRTAERMVDDDDVLETEKVFHGRNRFQAGDGATGCNRNREKLPRVSHAIARFVEDVLARVDFTGEVLCYDFRDLDIPTGVAVE